MNAQRICAALGFVMLLAGCSATPPPPPGVKGEYRPINTPDTKPPTFLTPKVFDFKYRGDPEYALRALQQVQPQLIVLPTEGKRRAFAEAVSDLDLGTCTAHPTLEALLTVDEEAGMGGARGLSADWLRGRLLLNLDTEEWGQFYLGCAGGVDVNVSGSGVGEAVPDGYHGLRIALGGLRGGHSGVDIHEGRGHAIKALVRVLRSFERRVPFRLARLQGGPARNALPREAFAELAVPVAELPRIDAFLADWQAVLRAELAGVDENVVLTSTPCAVERVLPLATQGAWLGVLHAAPQGPRRMSVQVHGVVETSDNLGVVEVTPEAGKCCFMVRSLVDSAALDLAQEIVSLCSLAGLEARMSGQYPGWRPNPASPLLAVCQSTFRAVFAETSATQVIHAGLECAIIGGKYPAMDMVSFGPTIRGAHAPGECLEVASVERCWRLLTAILAELRA